LAHSAVGAHDWLFVQGRVYSYANVKTYVQHRGGGEKVAN
jgi:hypothetical protein